VKELNKMSSPRILLVSAWNNINIGSVSHAPGDIGVLEAHVPEAHITFWAPSNMDDVTERLLKQRYPKLDIVKGTINEDGSFSEYGDRHPAERLAQAVQSSDFMLHGSGSSFQYRREVAAYVRATGKPFGVLGITDIRIPDDLALLNTAKFVYFRDTPGLIRAQQGGLSAPVMAYGPDSAFYCDWRNEVWAENYLEEVGLREGKFVCVIGRFRYTPSWRLDPKLPIDPDKHAFNEEKKENDFAPLRNAICAIVRETDLDVLVCPEDMTQMAIEKEMIIDLLPSDVRQRVIWREHFWMTDEALSVYVRSAALFGIEMHSFIMGIGNGIPAVICHAKEHTTKGCMWEDIGLGDWLFDLDDQAQMDRLTPTLLDIISQPHGAKAKVAQANVIVRRSNEEMATVLREALER
jgi:hypothetical protein